MIAARDLDLEDPGESNFPIRRWAYEDESSNFGPRFGNALALGDFDGDGLQDLAIGAPGWFSSPDMADERAGAVYLFYGKGEVELPGLETLPVPGTADALFVGASGDQLGRGLRVADLDGDGLDDLVIGAPGASLESSPLNSGLLWLVWGASERWSGSTSIYQLSGAATPLSGSAEDGIGQRLEIIPTAPTVGNWEGNGLLLGGNQSGGVIYVLAPRSRAEWNRVARRSVESLATTTITSGEELGSALDGPIQAIQAPGGDVLIVLADRGAEAGRGAVWAFSLADLVAGGPDQWSIGDAPRTLVGSCPPLGSALAGEAQGDILRIYVGAEDSNSCPNGGVYSWQIIWPIGSRVDFAEDLPYVRGNAAQPRGGFGSSLELVPLTAEGSGLVDDGWSELAVGSPYESLSSEKSRSGSVYLVNSTLWAERVDGAPPSMPDDSFLRIYVGGHKTLGVSLATGFLDEDDNRDLVIGAPMLNPQLGNTAAGAAYVLYGMDCNFWMNKDVDKDGDGWLLCAVPADCNDEDASINPGVQAGIQFVVGREWPDQNCDGLAGQTYGCEDEGRPRATGGVGSCTTSRDVAVGLVVLAWRRRRKSNRTPRERFG